MDARLLDFCLGLGRESRRSYASTAMMPNGQCFIEVLASDRLPFIPGQTRADGRHSRAHNRHTRSLWPSHEKRISLLRRIEDARRTGRRLSADNPLGGLETERPGRVRFAKDARLEPRAKCNEPQSAAHVKQITSGGLLLRDLLPRLADPRRASNWSLSRADVPCCYRVAQVSVSSRASGSQIYECAPRSLPGIRLFSKEPINQVVSRAKARLLFLILLFPN